jgi:hypothetical protein
MSGTIVIHWYPWKYESYHEHIKLYSRSVGHCSFSETCQVIVLWLVSLITYNRHSNLPWVGVQAFFVQCTVFNIFKEVLKSVFLRFLEMSQISNTLFLSGRTLILDQCNASIEYSIKIKIISFMLLIYLVAVGIFCQDTEFFTWSLFGSRCVHQANIVHFCIPYSIA